MKVISFSLWGSQPKYCVGAIKNAIQAKEYYPDWLIRFYVDNTVPCATISRLLSLNAQIIVMKKSLGTHGALWRFLAASDPDVEVMISRDCDSRLSNREAKAVQEWLNSGRILHLIKDHPWHANDNILAGLWGCRSEAFRHIEECYGQWPDRCNTYGHDQRFLDQFVYPIGISNSCVHNDDDPAALLLSEVLPSYRFLGLQYDENENPDYESIVAKAIHVTGKTPPAEMRKGFKWINS